MVVMLILFCAVNLFAQQNGVITELYGTVELKPSGQTGFIPAKAGDTVAMDTIVSTGFKSTALIKAGSTVLTVRPLTRLSLSELSGTAGTETLNVSLQTGRVKVDVKPPAGTRTNMTVQSPTATASVRGTSFEFDTQSLTVLEGTVAFQGSNGGVMLVNAGSTSDISVNGRSADPVETYAANLLPPAPVGIVLGNTSSGTAAPGIIEGDGEFGLEFVLQ